MRMKKIFRVFCLVLVLVSVLSPGLALAESRSSDYTSGTYVTPFGASLPISRYNWTESSVAYPDVGTKYPQAVLVEAGTNTYNCFTYAFIYSGITTGLSSMPASEKFFLNSPAGLMGISNPCYEYVDFDDVVAGDIAVYRADVDYQYHDYGNDLHAGIVYQKGSTLANTQIISKWGQYGIYRHTIDHCPYTYSGISLASIGNVSPAYIIQPPEQYTVPVEVYFVRMTHTFAYYSTEADGQGTIANDTYHKVRCTDCGAFHFEEHNESEYEAIVTQVGNLTSSVYHKVLCGCGYYHRQEMHTFASDGICVHCGHNSGFTMNQVEEEEVTE